MLCWICSKSFFEIDFLKEVKALFQDVTTGLSGDSSVAMTKVQNEDWFSWKAFGKNGRRRWVCGGVSSMIKRRGQRPVCEVRLSDLINITHSLHGSAHVYACRRARQISREMIGPCIVCRGSISSRAISSVVISENTFSSEVISSCTWYFHTQLQNPIPAISFPVRSQKLESCSQTRFLSAALVRKKKKKKTGVGFNRLCPLPQTSPLIVNPRRSYVPRYLRQIRTQTLGRYSNKPRSLQRYSLLYHSLTSHTRPSFIHSSIHPVHFFVFIRHPPPISSQPHFSTNQQTTQTQNTP